jgi:uncharacterized protein
VSLVLDTGIVYAYYDRSDAWHGRARAVMKGRERALILPAPVIPEVDHLLGHRLGSPGRRVFYQGIVEGHYYVADLPRRGYARVAEIDKEFEDLDLGFVDAAVVAIAAGLNLSRVATTDRRHFAALASRYGLQLIP